MGRILFGGVVLFAVLQFGPAWPAARFDPTSSFGSVQVTMLAEALAITGRERLTRRVPPSLSMQQ
ncbi:MAG: hypothetical protein FJW14_03350 [Acidimicrobiia bacterium]|nr:hypothetical protein [Acidimicrobiia bacterium]